MPKSVNEILRTALIEVAGQYGVAIERLEASWIDTSSMRGQEFSLSGIELSNCKLCNPTVKQD